MDAKMIIRIDQNWSGDDRAGGSLSRGQKIRPNDNDD